MGKKRNKKSVSAIMGLILTNLFLIPNNLWIAYVLLGLEYCKPNTADEYIFCSYLIFIPFIIGIIISSVLTFNLCRNIDINKYINISLVFFLIQIFLIILFMYYTTF